MDSIIEKSPDHELMNIRLFGQYDSWKEFWKCPFFLGWGGIQKINTILNSIFVKFRKIMKSITSTNGTFPQLITIKRLYLVISSSWRSNLVHIYFIILTIFLVGAVYANTLYSWITFPTRNIVKIMK